MTAEIAVLNSVGVAMAADSAATVRAPRKIYASAEKVFHLVDDAPVGAMVYGQAELVDLPWEMLIKQYRRAMVGRVFPTIEDYSKDLLRFLRASRRWFPQSAQDEEAVFLVRCIFSHVRESIIRTLKEQENGGIDLTETIVRSTVKERVDRQCAEIRNHALITGFGPRVRKHMRARYAGRIAEHRKEIFQDLPMSQGTSQKIGRMGIDLLSRGFIGPLRSGIVVAGFGEDEAMPAFSSISFESLVEGRPRAFMSRSGKITHESLAAVVPFAQQEMVQTFMEGIDPTYDEYVSQ